MISFFAFVMMLFANSIVTKKTFTPMVITFFRFKKGAFGVSDKVIFELANCASGIDLIFSRGHQRGGVI